MRDSADFVVARAFREGTLVPLLMMPSVEPFPSHVVIVPGRHRAPRVRPSPGPWSRGWTMRGDDAPASCASFRG